MRTTKGASIGGGSRLLMDRLRLEPLPARHHKASLGQKQDERRHRRGGHARIGSVARVVAVRLVVEGAVRTLCQREPPAIGVHEPSEARGIDARAQRRVAHAH
ncbi:MAG: hypothetical protein ACK55I_07725, partial [bacterium]